MVKHSLCEVWSMDAVAIPKDVVVQLEVISDLFGSSDMISPYFQGQGPSLATIQTIWQVFLL